MAKFNSQVYTTIRGSVGGVTYTANQYAPMMARARRAPVNPNTDPQSAMRSAFSGASQMWKDIPEATRQGWSDYAETLEYPGPVNTYKVSGRSVFLGNIGLASYINALDPVAIPNVNTDPPLIGGFLTTNSIGSQPLADPGIGFEIACSWVSDENALLWSQRSFAFNPTRYRFKGPYLSSTNVGEDMHGPGGYRQSFTGLIADKIFFTRSRIITAQAPFRTSIEYFLRHVATEVVAP